MKEINFLNYQINSVDCIWVNHAWIYYIDKSNILIRSDQPTYKHSHFEWTFVFRDCEIKLNNSVSCSWLLQFINCRIIKDTKNLVIRSDNWVVLFDNCELSWFWRENFNELNGRVILLNEKDWQIFYN